MKIFTQNKKKHGFALALLSLLSFNGFSQTYTWTGATDTEFSTLTNWSDNSTTPATNPAAFTTGIFLIPAGKTAQNTTTAVSPATLTLEGTAILNGSKAITTSNFNLVNNSIINLTNPGTADLTVINLRATAGNTIAGGTVNIGDNSAATFKATLNTKSLLLVGSGTGNVATINIYPNGNLTSESGLLRIHHSRDNASGTVNVLGANLTIGEIQIGENTTADIGTGTLNLQSGSLTTTTLGVPRSGSNTNAINRLNITNGTLTINTTLLIGNNGKIEFKGGSGALKSAIITKTDLEAFITAAKITKPDGYDWVWDTTSGVTLSVALATTPVEIISYNISKKENNIQLNWASASENNNEKYTIERSSNGVDFLIIGNVKGENTASSYSFIDKNPNTGNNYYRLTQTDFNGTSKVIGIKSANFSLVNQENISVYPNPVTDKINIKTTEDKGSVKEISITNMNGEVVLQTKSSASDIELNITKKLAPGIYILHVKGELLNASKRIIVQ